MPLIEVFRCDSCHTIIETLTDVYRIEMKGEAWYPISARKGSVDLAQSAKDLGFCSSCAGNIADSLAKIAEAKV